MNKKKIIKPVVEPFIYPTKIGDDYKKRLQGLSKVYPSLYEGGSTSTGSTNPTVSTNQATNKVEETPTINKTKDALNNYKNQLKLDTANVQSEIMSANKLANQYLQNYLKQQGILGTGIGQSQYTNLATNYANQMAQAKIDEQTKYQQALQQYQEGRTEELATLLSTMSEDERESYLQEVARTEGLDQRYLDTLATQSKVLSSQEAQQSIEYVKSLIDYGADATVIQKAIDDLKAKGVDTTQLETLSKATGTDIKTQATQMYTEIVNKLKTGNLGNETAQYQKIRNELLNAIRTNNTKSMSEVYQQAFNLISGVADLNEEDFDYSKQYVVLNNQNAKYFKDDAISTIMELSNGGFIPNGTVMKGINRGSSTGAIVYYNGQWYEATKEQATRGLTFMEILTKYGM